MSGPPFKSGFKVVVELGKFYSLPTKDSKSKEAFSFIDKFSNSPENGQSHKTNLHCFSKFLYT